MVTLLHLSDLHIHEHPGHSRNLRLGVLVTWILDNYEHGATNVVITGDLVDDGEREQYEQLVALLMPLKAAGFRLLIAPGNHDLGRMGNVCSIASRVHFQRYVGGGLMGLSAADTVSDVMSELYPLVHPLDGVTFVGLDSDAGGFVDGTQFARGAIGSAQLERLQKILDAEAGKQPIVVYLHHHPFDRGFALCLSDASDLMTTINGRADLLLFGHKHKSESWPSDDDGPLIASRVTIASGSTTRPDLAGNCEFREIRLADGKFTVSKRRVSVG